MNDAGTSLVKLNVIFIQFNSFQCNFIEILAITTVGNPEFEQQRLVGEGARLRPHQTDSRSVKKPRLRSEKTSGTKADLSKAVKFL